jgi:hypothetical protein
MIMAEDKKPDYFLNELKEKNYSIINVDQELKKINKYIDKYLLDNYDIQKKRPITSTEINELMNQIPDSEIKSRIQAILLTLWSIYFVDTNRLLMDYIERRKSVIYTKKEKENK